MAIYSCNISNVSRGKGSSSCATLSYISAEKVKEERTGETYSYGRSERVIEVGTLIPSNAPEEFQNPEVLFNSIENFEKAENARTAKKIMVALPKEFDINRQKEVIENYIKDNITSKNYACTYAIHTDKDNSNPHAHILIANRQINKKGEWSSKRKMEYALDEQGERIPQIDKATGEQKKDKNGRKQWKRINVEVNPLDKKETLQSFREAWAGECNRYLEEKKKIDHRSYADQEKEEEPTIHEGYVARKIEQQGGVSEICEQNRQIRQRNNLLKQIKEQLKTIGEQLKEFTKEKGASVNDRIGELLKRREVVKSGRGVADGERSAVDTDTETLIREARTGIDSATAKEKDSGASRAHRDAERERQRVEAKRAEIERKRTEAERKSKARERSRGFEMER